MGTVSSQPENVSEEQLLGNLEKGIHLYGALNLKNKCFRTLHCHLKNDEYDSVVKVCFVRGIDLSPYYERIASQNKLLSKAHSPNVLSFHRIKFQSTTATTESAPTAPAFLIRQHFLTSLKDRLSTRPFLSDFEKLWIAYSMVQGLNQLHSCGIKHGDLKAENVLINSWGWVVLSDMAPFKPTLLEADQSAAHFNFFFSMGGKKRCYLAPERFVKGPLYREEEATVEMDLFALGMVLIEVFTVDGVEFELSDALEYSAKGISAKLTALVDRIPVKEIQHMCAQLTQFRPSDRMPLKLCLDMFPSTIKLFLYPFMQQSLLASTTNAGYNNTAATGGTNFTEVLVWKTCEAFESILEHLRVKDDVGVALFKHLLVERKRMANDSVVTTSAVVNDEDEHLTRARQVIQLAEQTSLKPRPSSSFLKEEEHNDDDDNDEGLETRSPLEENLLIVLSSFLGVCVVKAPLVQTRVVAMLLLKHFACIYGNDEFTLGRVLPFIVHRLTGENERSVLCRCVAVETVAHLLNSLVNARVPGGEARYFPDYLLPSLEKCSRDPCESVRVCFSKHLATFAGHAKRFLESVRMQQQHGGLSYDAEVNGLQDYIQRMMEKLTTSPSNNSLTEFSIKEGLVESMLHFCLFFGRERIESWLLPWFLSIFNITRRGNWQLQVSMLNVLPSVGAFVGPDAFNLFLFPLIEDMLFHHNSHQDLVVEAAANCVKTLVIYGLLKSKGKVFKLTERIVPLLRHPSVRVRLACFRVLGAIFTTQSHTDVQLFLVQYVRPYFLQQDAFLLLGKTGMGERETLLLMHSFSLVPACPSLSQWAKEYHKSIVAPPPAVVTAGLAGSASKRMGEERIHTLVVDESQLKLNSVFGEYGVVEDVEETCSLTSLSSRIRALELQPLKFNLGRVSRLMEEEDDLPGSEEKRKPKASSSSTNNNWEIRGNLVTPLLEHTGPVKRIQVSEDSTYFTTGSEDGTVKLWVCAKLDRNPCPKSRITFGIPGGAVADLCLIQSTSSFAVASASGQISVIRSDGPSEAFKHGKLVSQQRLVSIACPTSVELYACTETGSLHSWDLRSAKSCLEKLVLLPGLGSVSCMATSKSWLVLGTHRGVVAIFDLRFQMLLVAWRHPNSCAINRLHVSPSIEGPLVLVSAGRNQCMLLNIDTGHVQSSFVVCGNTEFSDKLACTRFLPVNPDQRVIIDRYIAEAQMAHYGPGNYHSFNIRAMLCPNDILSGHDNRHPGKLTSLLTAGSDLTIRQWNTTTHSLSCLISAPPGEDRPKWEAKKLGDSSVFVSLSPSNVGGTTKSEGNNKSTSRFTVRTSHTDAILDLAGIRMQDARYLLVSAGRDGAVKVWQ